MGEGGLISQKIDDVFYERPPIQEGGRAGKKTVSGVSKNVLKFNAQFDPIN